MKIKYEFTPNIVCIICDFYVEATNVRSRLSDRQSLFGGPARCLASKCHYVNTIPDIGDFVSGRNKEVI